MSRRDRVVWCDGSGGVGPSATCYYCVQTNKDTTVYEAGHDLDNNIVEYMAMIKALDLVPNGGTVITDSQMIVNHLNGRQQCKVDMFKKYFNKAKRMKIDKHVRVTWVSRKDNKAGKSLEQFIKMAKKQQKIDINYIPLDEESPVPVKPVVKKEMTFRSELIDLVHKYEVQTGMIIEGIDIIRNETETPEIKVFGQLGEM